MKNLLNNLNNRHENGRKSLCILIDPDKIEEPANLAKLALMANESYVDYFFVGGSLITNNHLSSVIKFLKAETDIPVVLFPGSNMHIDSQADGLLFLSLISGRNPEFLIGQHVVAAPIVKNSSLEVLPTGYILVNSGKPTAVSYMSNTTPIPADKYSVAASTAMAGQLLGLRLIYLDAGSGADAPISPKMINKVKSTIDIPLIVGGGISSKHKAKQALDAGADVIVIGNAIEKDPNLLIEVSELIYDMNKSLDIH